MCAGGQWPGIDVSRCGRDLHSDHSDVCVQVVSGQVHMSLGVDEIYTLTTVMYVCRWSVARCRCL